MKHNTRIFTCSIILFAAFGAACTSNKTHIAENPTAASLPPQPSQTIIQLPQPSTTEISVPAATEPPQAAIFLTPTFTSIPPSLTPTPLPSLNWEEAASHLGEKQSVCGPVLGAAYASTSEGQPTFLNIGENFPDENRFSVVIWGDARENFSTPPETAYLGKTICIHGEISQFEGVVQVTVEFPTQISLP